MKRKRGGALAAWCAALIAVALDPPSCASRSASKPPAVPRAVAAESRVGTVHFLGAGGRFVLIEAASASVAAQLHSGQELRCGARIPSAPGVATARVRISRVQRPPFIVADVVEGTPELGQSVFTSAAAPPEAPPGSIPGNVSSQPDVPWAGGLGPVQPHAPVGR